MSSITRSGQVVLVFLLGLVVTVGVRAQDNFHSHISLGIPDEIRRFSAKSEQKREIPEVARAETLRKPFVSDYFAAKTPAESGIGNFTALGRQPEDDPKTSKSGSIKQNNFRLGAALTQSLLFLAIQHGFRMTQEKTTRELGGPFFEDWGRSLKGFRGWRDTDNGFTNYIAHPFQGAITGRIYTSNSREGEIAEFGKSRRYLKSRLEAFVWSTFWSAQFELGPISEATLGNVGMTKKNGEGTMGWVDMVMTPVGGTAFLIGEDAIEKYVLKRMLRDTGGRVTTGIKIWRSLLTPSMSFTNLLSGKPPWSRRSNFLAAMPSSMPGDTAGGSPAIKVEGDKDK